MRGTSQEPMEFLAQRCDLALSWAWRLVEAIDELKLWEPGRKGYAAALRRLGDERDWAVRELSGLRETPASRESQT